MSGHDVARWTIRIMGPKSMIPMIRMEVEIRHSNFLAFILDPAESHGQRGAHEIDNPLFNPLL
jgi:hypothetical protein